MKRALLLLGFLLSATPARAGLVDPIGTPSQVLDNVGVYDQAIVNLDSPVTVYLTGTGIRVKHVVFTDVDLYVAASYIDKIGGLSAADPLSGLAQSSTKVMMLTLVRDVTADQIRTAWQDALLANNVDLNSPGVKSLLDQITMDVSQGTTINLVGVGDDLIRVQLSTGQQFTSVQDPGLTLNFWRAWFGNSVDDNMATLKGQLAHN